MKFFSRLLFCSSLISCALFATEPFLEQPAIAAYSSHGKKTKSKSTTYEGIDSWKPYFTHISNVQNDHQRSFVLSTIGVGFIYFSKVKGDLSLSPAPVNSATNGTNTKKVGGFSYNRTPLYELVIGYRIFDWLKAGLALQNQNNIHFQSPFAPTVVPAQNNRVSTTTLPQTQFRANIALNGIYLKAMFELPTVMILKSWMYALFFNANIGVAWQSWTDIRQYVQYQVNNLESTFVNTLHQKYGASALWQFDAGLRIKSAGQSDDVSFLLGCKFISWGKVPNIGESTQQGPWRFSFRKPYNARMLYSFAPYLGVQWNF